MLVLWAREIVLRFTQTNWNFAVNRIFPNMFTLKHNKTRRKQE